MRLHEVAGEPLVLSMLRRLDKMMKARRVYYRWRLDVGWTVIQKWTKDVSPPGIDLVLDAPERVSLGGSNGWVAFLPMEDLERFTIRSQGEGDEKTWTLEPRTDEDET